MTKKERLRREKARRAMFDLKELVIDVLAEHRDGLYHKKLQTKHILLFLKESQTLGTSEQIWLEVSFPNY